MGALARKHAWCLVRDGISHLDTHAAAVLDSLRGVSEVAEFGTDRKGLASRLCYLPKRGVEFVGVCRLDRR